MGFLLKLRSGRSQKGSVLVEFSLTMALLVLFLVGLVDLCLWLNSHLRATRFAYEAARYLASLPGLEEGKSEVLGPAGVVHQRAQDRIRKLRESYGLADEVVDLETAFYRAASATDSKAAGTVSVDIEFDFTPLLRVSGWAYPNVHARADAPYLVE